MAEQRQSMVWLWVGVLVVAPIVIALAFVDQVSACPQTAALSTSAVCTTAPTVTWQGVWVITLVATAAAVIAVVQLMRGRRGA